jgi:hypothetical protein
MGLICVSQTWAGASSRPVTNAHWFVIRKSQQGQLFLGNECGWEGVIEKYALSSVAMQSKLTDQGEGLGVVETVPSSPPNNPSFICSESYALESYSMYKLRQLAAELNVVSVGFVYVLPTLY